MSQIQITENNKQKNEEMSNLVSEKYSRIILQGIINYPKSARKISTEYNILLSTVYRRLDALLEKKILRTTGIIDENEIAIQEAEFKESLQDYKDTAKEGNTGPQIIPIGIPVGTSSPGCEEANECYLPSSMNINLDDVVIWTNQDTAAHTVTSGSPSEGPDGNFDSSLILAGGTFEFPFDTSGNYNYFCMVHPWMTGTISVTS